MAPRRSLAMPPCPNAARSPPQRLQTLAPGGDGLFVRLARRVYEARRDSPLRFQGVFVGGGVDEVRAGWSRGFARMWRQAPWALRRLLPCFCFCFCFCWHAPRQLLPACLVCPNVRPNGCPTSPVKQTNPLPVPQDAMHYWVDNMFRPDKAPYCSNCSRDADCLALLLVGGAAAGGPGTAASAARREHWACTQPLCK